MKASGRGCGTCKDRRISCDRTLPLCLHCVRSNRQCKGYELRLSWPRATDRKRAMIGPAPSKVKGSSIGTSPLRLMNTSVSDIEIHYYLTGSRFKTLPAIPTPMSWGPIKLSADYNLLEYFTSHVSNSLVAIQPTRDSPGLRDILMRVALSQNTPSSTAVLQSVLALSSLHRHGLQAHAARLKVSALSALAASARTGIKPQEVMAHVSALMVLCCFEIQQVSESSNQWVNYISSVKNVLKSVDLGSFEKSSDMAALLYWVSYHDILSRFSLRYWKHSGSMKALSQTAPDDVDILIKHTTLLEAWDSSLICPRMFSLVKEVLNMAMGSHGPYEEKMVTLLEWRIRRDLVCNATQESHPGSRFLDDPDNQELFQLALLVYLERSSNSSFGQSPIMRSRLDRAFTILSQLQSIQRQFPLLILGCEARADNNRMVILNLISRTEEASGGRSLDSLKVIIQSLWAQDDLAEQELGYSDKIEAVVSSSSTLPSFT